jgi:succinate-semialdehyde dehydrogenase/glutarate-semialdehyde dehydrogenase
MARERLAVLHPVTGKELGWVEVATAGDVEAAVERARGAQAAWREVAVRERARVLERFHKLLFERRDEILDTVQNETGKTRRDAFGELLAVAATASYYAARGERYLAEEVRDGAVPLVTGGRVQHPPLGVVGFITPWNYPLLLAIGDALPALLAGNAVVIKPSEVTPLSAELAVRLLAEAGLPDGLASLVHGPGAAVGPELIARVDAVAFTGSVATGRRVAVAAAERLIPCSLELGGKNPMIVLDGAHLDEAAAGLMTGAFYNCGQTCIAVERVYVEKGSYEAFVERAARRAEALRVGWSLGWEMDVGSQVGRAHSDKVMAHVEDAVRRGARVVAGGRRREDLGPAFVEPTLLTDVAAEATLHAEETFGPVVAIYPADDAEAAVAAANDSAYGLNASVWTGNRGRSLDLARRIEAGAVGVNSTLLVYHTLDVPMGGMKGSGLGRRHGRPGLLRFTRTRSVVTGPSLGGGYEALLSRADSSARAGAIARLFRLRARIPGLR